MKKLLIFILLVIYFEIHFLYAWNDEAHKMISNWSISQSIFGKTAFYEKLNFDKGIQGQYSILDGVSKTLFDWIIYGAIKEDEKISYLSKRRFDNHFHNPLKENWLDAGLYDYILTILFTGSSVMQWAQSSFLQKDYPEGDNSWRTIRDYYFQALTSIKENDRENYFSRVFKGIGHQIHLIEDTSVPEHVRNDAHNPLKNKYGQFNIEQWAERDIKNSKGFMLNYCSSQPIFPQINFNFPAPDLLDPIAFLIDNNIYLGYNPSNLCSQGLSEFTNANFFSEDTIFADLLPINDIHYFPFPRIESTNIISLLENKLIPEEIDSEDGKKDVVFYIKKIKDGEIGIDGKGFHLNAVSYFKKFLSSNYRRAFYINELCQRDYASLLVPRTVGYSAALINYFFRGEIEVTLPESDGIYSFCFVPAEGFKKISVMVKNITPDNEEMKNGRVSLVLSYRLGSSTPFVPDPPIPGVERIYKIFDYINPDPNITKIDIPRDTPIRLDFDLTSNPLPTDAVDVTLTVVFKGDLGAELTDAVAIGFKDISEPTPIDLFNHTDKVCFNNNYVNYNDAALWAFVDVNPQNGKIDCLNNAEIDITRKRIGQQTKGVFVYFSFNGSKASSTNYFFKYDDGWEILPGETPYRFFVLTNAYPTEFKYSILVHAKPIDSDVCIFTYYPTTVASNIPYTNKLEWSSSSEPQHLHTPLKYTFGFLHGIFMYFENTYIPESSNCSASSSGSSSLSSQSKINAALDTPRINCVFPIKKLE